MLTGKQTGGLKPLFNYTVSILKKIKSKTVIYP
jgi:hypothetical protein